MWCREQILRAVRSRFRWIGALACALWVAQCGGSSSGPTPPDGGTPPPAAGLPADATIRISAEGVSPVEVRIPVGGRVTFFNGDARPHSIFSDPATTHSDCPNINVVGFLSQGQSRDTRPLTTARTCGFHDHLNEDNPAFMGRIVVE